MGVVPDLHLDPGPRRHCAPDHLVGVVDVKAERAADVAGRVGAPAFTDIRDVLGFVDAVSIAVPTESHVEVALPFVDRGIAVLVGADSRVTVPAAPLTSPLGEQAQELPVVLDHAAEARRQDGALRPGGAAGYRSLTGQLSDRSATGARRRPLQGAPIALLLAIYLVAVLLPLGLAHSQGLPRRPVTDELSAALLAELGPAALVELNARVGLLNATARGNIALGIRSEHFAEACGLPPLAQPSPRSSGLRAS